MSYAPVVTTTSIILSSDKIQNGDILVSANPRPPGKWPSNEHLYDLMLLWWSKTDRLKWFGHVKWKDEASWVKWCMMMDVDGTRPGKAWWACLVEDMKCLGLSQQEEKSRNNWRRIIKWAAG